MKLLLLTFAILIFSPGMRSQSIIAGQHGPDDYYYDFDPDVTITAPAEHTPEYPIDLNGDGIIDIAVEARGAGGAMGFGNCFVKVNLKNNNQAAFAFFDTCYGIEYCAGSSWVFSLTKSFLNNDTINANITWSYNTSIYIQYDKLEIFCYHCMASVSQDTLPVIVGIRINNQDDTLYGWIKISGIWTNTFGSSFTLQEYACNKGSIGIQESMNNTAIRVYPNPCKDKLIVNHTFPVNRGELALFDLEGHELQRQQINNRIIQMDISSLARGVYYIRLVSDKIVLAQKVIKN